MKTNYYITKDGKLKRRENTVYFVDTEGNRYILPVQRIYAIYAYGNITITSGVISYLSKLGIPIHFFNIYEFYRGSIMPRDIDVECHTGNEEYLFLDDYEASLYPRERLISGELLIEQARHYIDHEKRMALAKEFVRGAGANILKNLGYYNRGHKELDTHIESIENEMADIDGCKTIPELMSVEGRIRDIYYSAFDIILPEKFRFEKRTRRPPENMLNAMISFGNSLLYTTVLTEIYNTQLNPTISYLHEPFQRRFSLSLDISEIFKPIIVDRVIFKLTNKNMIDESDFRKEFNYYLLNDKGRRTFLREYEDKLTTTIMHKGLKRKISFQRLIRLECYKLIHHLLGGKKYKAFVMWW